MFILVVNNIYIRMTILWKLKRAINFLEQHHTTKGDKLKKYEPGL